MKKNKSNKKVTVYTVDLDQLLNIAEWINSTALVHEDCKQQVSRILERYTSEVEEKKINLIIEKKRG